MLLGRREVRRNEEKVEDQKEIWSEREMTISVTSTVINFGPQCHFDGECPMPLTHISLTLDFCRL